MHVILLKYQQIRDSVIGDNIMPLEEFVYESALRFRRGGAGRDLGATLTSRLALLVSIAIP